MKHMFLAALLVTIVTAYNAGVVGQNDSSPCLGARNFNVCEALLRGESICAANWAPLGTRLKIEGYGTCTIRDRMAKKYGTRVDIAMPANAVDKALAWGKRSVIVKIIK